jgi:enoyl-CoA hydratase
MPNLKNILKKVENGILTISIDRPDKMNALNGVTLDELRSVFIDAYDDQAVKGIILTGVGSKSFVAGADIRDFKELNELNGRKFSENGQEVFSIIENCHKPVIAVVNGYALGGGCELAMACHMRIASQNAQFGQPEVGLGLIPAYGGTQRLTHLIGKGHALEMMMTGNMVSAQKALSLGLVNHVLETKEEAIAKAEELLQKIFENAPLAIGMVINCVNTVFSPEVNGYQTEANSFANCCKSSDFKEGTTAFLEKRKPEFKGE